MSSDSSCQTMKVVEYEVEVSDSVLESLHGISHTITEYYIPEHNLCFNVNGGKLNIFKRDWARGNECVEYAVSKNLIDNIVFLYAHRQLVYDLVRKWISDISAQKVKRE